jgi:hypothetical protein
MFGTKRTLLCVGLALLTACSGTLAATRIHPQAPCNGLDGACVPRRLTYGYTPTTWRRWPNATLAGQKAATEELPTPAAEPATETKPSSTESTAPEEPITIPDEAPLMPEKESPPTTTPTKPETAPLMPPFEDSPPTPPKQLEGDTTAPPSDTPEFSPLPPPTIEPEETKSRSLDSDPPPVMPDEDPFRDDPPSPRKPSSSLTPSSGGPALSAAPEPDAPEEVISQASMRWRVATRTPERSAGKLKQVVSEDPQGLVPAEPTEEGQGESSPGAAMRRNPLRSASAKNDRPRIVPVASWSDEQRPGNASSEIARRNPLRSN